MQIKTLKNVNYAALLTCYNEAFANYFVPFNINEAYLVQRCQGARIDLEASFGVFDKDKIVGFMLIGVDDLQGKRTAHNDGTGIIPAYRGKQLVDKMYQKAIPIFKEKGIEQCSLEVIQENARAISVYERIGFQQIRSLNCFGGKIINKNTPVPKDVRIEKTENPKWERYSHCFDFIPAWNNALAYPKGLKDKFDCLEIFEQEHFVGFAIIDQSGALPTFGILPKYRKLGYGRLLFESLASVNPKIRTNNVNSTALNTIQFLEKMGLSNTVNQFEMRMDI